MPFRLASLPEYRISAGVVRDLFRAKLAARRNLTPLGFYRGMVVVGCEPGEIEILVGPCADRARLLAMTIQLSWSRPC